MYALGCVMKVRKDDGREDEERERVRWSCLVTDGASNVIFTRSMTRCGGAAARHSNSKPDRPVCLPTVLSRRQIGYRSMIPRDKHRAFIY
jgi:hypothetical protein